MARKWEGVAGGGRGTGVYRQSKLSRYLQKKYIPAYMREVRSRGWWIDGDWDGCPI